MNSGEKDTSDYASKVIREINRSNQAHRKVLRMARGGEGGEEVLA
jgi:hypothetical protein